MIGVSSVLSTKQDYINIKNDFPDHWQPRWQELLDTRFSWLPVGELAEDDEGITDDTHRVSELKDENEVVISRTQEEYMEDPACKLLRIGFTIDEVTAALAGD